MSELLSRVDFAWVWAWAILPLPLLSRFLRRPDQPRRERVRVPLLPMLIGELTPDSPPARSDWRHGTLFWLIWTLLVCALAQPQFLTLPQYTRRPMRDMVLILDVSGSMGKTDVQEGVTRLQAVQDSVRKFVAARQSDRTGLVIFASHAWPFAPVSEDKRALITRINQLTPGMIGQQTAIGDALGVAVKMLDSDPHRDASKLAILLTDGHDTASQRPPELTARLAAAHHVQVHTIAFGDLNGEDNGRSAALLKTIASTTGGKNWTAANSGAALDSVWREIDALAPVAVKSLGWSWHQPLFAWPLGAAMFLLLIPPLVRLIKVKRG
ncbi:VWA domain-containing protein [Klebsiella sp. I138]|uniref:VWA domain-containing protein n=1 Tax=Klebsiella sp. I138 TaxID=2755385 RepID=UPI003DA8FD1A